MSGRIGQTGVTTEDLQMYFDGELGGAEARELAAQIEASPELKAELEQLGLLHGLVTEGLAAKAQAVPQARFEQIWDEIGRAIDRDARREDDTRVQPSLWARLRTALRQWRLPMVAAMGAAAVTVVVMNVGDRDGGTAASEGPNNSPMLASEQPSSRTEGASDAELEPQEAAPDMVAHVPPNPPPAGDVSPGPRAVEAEIHEVEFGGRNGRISRGGTVTVLYVEEDVEQEDSERSL